MRRGWIAAGLALLALAACASPAPPEEQGARTPIYYLAAEDASRGGDRIRACYETLGLGQDATVRDEAAAVVSRLLEGPTDRELESPLPAGVELLSLEVRDRTAYVDLSGGFNQLAGVELSMADYCLTLSLTALDGIGAVRITAQGRPVGQQPKQVFYERDVLLSTMDDVLQTVEVTLYFQDGGGTLTGERRTLTLYEGQTLAESLMAALLEGPASRELSPTLPENFTVNYVRIENGICYVSLPAASLALLPEDEQAQRTILWSLAESLYSIAAVDELRLLADGEELAYFGLIPVETVASRPQG
ncbi:MAG: GerMN domain-containing protein [Oscillospiraceae bacterium]|jgi:germination protein M|nr:GerMN domain-containing protein [Oscillospiraceae bacterium]